MKTVGFRSTGTLCYYGSHPLPHHERVDVRDIIQFVPRALVFIVVVALYSKLYLFLRRPDTIQLSSQIASGELSARKDSAVKMLRPLGKFGRSFTVREIKRTRRPGRTLGTARVRHRLP